MLGHRARRMAWEGAAGDRRRRRCLLERAAELKQQLVGFAQHAPRIRKQLTKALARPLGTAVTTDEAMLINVIDRFVLQARLPDGCTVVEQFAGKHRRLATICPRSERVHLLRVAAELAVEHPELMLRNPAKVARAWEFRRRERACVVEFFGTDFVVLPGCQVRPRLERFWDWRQRALARSALAAAARPLPPIGYHVRDVGMSPPRILRRAVTTRLKGSPFSRTSGRSKRRSTTHSSPTIAVTGGRSPGIYGACSTSRASTGLATPRPCCAIASRISFPRTAVSGHRLW